MKWSRRRASEWGCIVSGFVAVGTFIVWLFGIKPSTSVLPPAIAVLAALACASLFYLGKRFDTRNPVSGKKSLDAFRNPNWETVTRRQFMNEQIDIDGKRFWDCTFNNVTLAFHGTAPAEFLSNCNFKLPLRLTTDSPPAMHFSKLMQIFSNLPGTRFEYGSTDERGNPLAPTFEIKELTAGSERRKDAGSKGAPLPDTSVKDSDPQVEIKFVQEQTCFDLINRGKNSSAQFACIEDFHIGGYRLVFGGFPPPIKPFGNHDLISPLYISNPDGTRSTKDIFAVLFEAWAALKNPKLYELPIPIKATYQDETRNLFETRCDLVYYQGEHNKITHGQNGRVVEIKNVRIRKVAAASVPINWTD